MPEHAPAPSLTFSVRHFDVAEGLPHRRVTSVAQDDQGYLWAATPAGLVRFDGYGFRNHTRNEGLSSDAVVQVVRDNSGLLWVRHEEGSLDLMDPRTGVAIPFAVHFRNRLLPGMRDRVTDLAASNAGTVVFAQEQALYRYASEREGFIRVQAPCSVA